jgi:hypothetical protein
MWSCGGVGDSRFPVRGKRSDSCRPDSLYTISGPNIGVSTETLVAPTWRLFDLARTATTLLGTLSLLAGCCGRFLSLEPRRRARSRRLAFGGSVSLVCVVSLNTVYRAISWAAAGSTGGLSPAGAFLPRVTRSHSLYGTRDTAATIPLSTAVEVGRTAAVSGLSMVCLGCGLWAVSTTDGTLRTAGVRGMVFGVALLVVSVGAKLFAGINYALAAGWSP